MRSKVVQRILDTTPQEVKDFVDNYVNSLIPVKLTLQHAIDNNFNGIDCIRFFRPNWTDEECDHYIWNLTCFPFSMESLIKQLNEGLGSPGDELPEYIKQYGNSNKHRRV